MMFKRQQCEFPNSLTKTKFCKSFVKVLLLNTFCSKKSHSFFIIKILLNFKFNILFCLSLVINCNRQKFNKISSSKI